MTNNYQLITIGATSSYRKDILDTFLRRTGELGIKAGKITILDAGNFSNYEPTAPAFCIYFGGPVAAFPDLPIVLHLQADAKLILPVIGDLGKFSNQIPTELRSVNGFQLDSPLKVEGLVSVVLEGLSLLRLTRRLFISYKRDESRPVAVQLFEELEAAGFDVFLDTHSIRPAQPFQSELWHRLVDTDVVVLLNTPSFLKSEWTTAELARANAMSVGILQLIWPGNKLKAAAQLSLLLKLDTSDFGNPLFESPDYYLSHDAVARVISTVESLRARSLAARQMNLVKEFIAIAIKNRAQVSVQPAKYVVLTKRNGDLLIFIPTVGIPQAFTYYQADQLVKMIKTGKVADVYLLYDHLYIRQEWLAHLAWLDSSFKIDLKIKTLRLLDAERLLPTLI